MRLVGDALDGSIAGGGLGGVTFSPVNPCLSPERKVTYVSSHRLRAEYENALSRARRAIYIAADLADQENDFGRSQDLVQLALEVSRLMDESLRQRPRAPLRGQLDIFAETPASRRRSAQQRLLREDRQRRATAGKQPDAGAGAESSTRTA